MTAGTDPPDGTDIHRPQHTAAETHARLERIAHPSSDGGPEIADADLADAVDRDVSILAMVGLLVIIVGIGLIAWGVTTPGFFSGGGNAVAVSCEAAAIAVPEGAPGDQVPPVQQVCVARVDGQVVRGAPNEIDDLVRQARNQNDPLSAARRKVWAGFLALIAGGVITVAGVVRARRASG